MGIHSRRSDFDPPPDKEIKDTTLDEFMLNEGSPDDELDCDPTIHTAEILSFYEPLLFGLLKPFQISSLVKQHFTKQNHRAFSKSNYPISVRLSYLPARHRGLRVLAYSSQTDHRRRLKQYAAVIDHTVLRKDRPIEKRFIETSSQFGFRVVFYSKSDDALLLTAEGVYSSKNTNCIVVVELAIANPGKVMFRHHYNSITQQKQNSLPNE